MILVFGCRFLGHDLSLAGKIRKDLILMNMGTWICLRTNKEEIYPLRRNAGKTNMSTGHYS
jgi:hypothetical protein